MPVWFSSSDGMSGSYPTRQAPSRAAGYTQVCFLLILGIGSLLVFSYQSEIYVILAAKDDFSSTSLVRTRPLGTRTHNPEIKIENETSRSRQEPEVFAVSGSDDEEELDENLDLLKHSAVVEKNVSVRRLESDEAPASTENGSQTPASLSTDMLSRVPDTLVNSSEVISPRNGRSASSVTVWAKESPRGNKNGKKLGNLTNPLYVPLEENVHTNLISTQFSFVIKVLATNSYGSLLRLLNSLDETDFGGDRVDLHIYIDHFMISSKAEAQRKQKRLLLQADASESNTNELVSNSDADEILQLEAEITSIGTEDVDGDGVEEDRVESSDVNDDKNADRVRGKKTKKKGKHSGSRKLGADASADVEGHPEVPDKVKNYDVVNINESWGIIESKLKDTRRVLGLAEQWEWRFGTKVVHYRSKAAGYQGQWIDSWWPSSDDEFALIIDDDLELSPLFYRYVRSIISTYYYQEAQYDPSVYGISLQRPQLVPGKSGHPIKLDVRTRLYMYQMVGIWGQVFFPKPWKEFRTWYDIKKSHDQKPILEGMVTTDWYRQHGEKMWTPWFVKFVHTQGYFSLYTNFLKDRVLSVSHRSESPKTKKYAGCDSNLIWENSTYDLDIFHMAPVKAIKRYDYCFKEVLVGRFANKSKEFSSVLSTVHENKMVLMLSTLNVPEALVRNWVCALSKLRVTNYLFFGEDFTLLQDLARRGYASLQFKFSERLTEDSEKEVDAVLTVLKLGYDVWFARADMIWVGNPLSLFDLGKTDMIGTSDPKLNLFYVKSTQETIDAWNSFQKQLNKAVQNSSRVLNFENAREEFVQKPDTEEKIRVEPLDKVTFLSAEKLTALPSEEGVEADKQVILFSQMRNNRDVARKATQLGLWNLDDDLVCTHVIC